MKKKILKAAALALVPSILLPSCSEYFWGDDIVSINEGTSTNPEGSVAIALNLDKEEKQLLDFITKLSQDIVDNPIVAKLFAKSPHTFAKVYGVDKLQINFDDAIWKLILALGDEDIHSAIKSDDISLFLSLCDKKGLITELQESDLSKFHNIIDKNPELIETREASLVVVLSAGVLVLAGAVAGLVAGVAAAGYKAAAVYDTVTFWDGSETRSAAQVMNKRAPQAYQVWVLKSDAKNTHVMLSEYQERLVNECVESLQQHFPEEMQKVDIHELKQTIALNLPK